MAESRDRLLFAVLLTVTWLASGCAGSPEPVARAPKSEPQTAAPAPSSPAPQSPATQETSPKRVPPQEISAEGSRGAKKDDPNVVVWSRGSHRSNSTDAASAAAR